LDSFYNSPDRVSPAGLFVTFELTMAEKEVLMIQLLVEKILVCNGGEECTWSIE
jgi:hypothetical protein